MKALGAAALGAGAAGFAYYHAQLPTSQLYGATICREPDAGRLIALTYDDGPNPEHTPALLEVLDRHGAKATFFSIGKWAQREPALLREVHAAGHAIGNHTQTHPTLALESSAGVTDELKSLPRGGGGRGHLVLRGGRGRPDATTVGPAPAGHPAGDPRRRLRTGAVVHHVLGLARARDRQRLRRAGKKARGGDVILLHDGSHLTPVGDRGNSVRATDWILEALVAEGYRFVTIPELVAAGRTS